MKTNPLPILRKITHPRTRKIVKLYSEGWNVEQIMFALNEKMSTVRAAIQQATKP